MKYLIYKYSQLSNAHAQQGQSMTDISAFLGNGPPPAITKSKTNLKVAVSQMTTEGRFQTRDISK